MFTVGLTFVFPLQVVPSRDELVANGQPNCLGPLCP